MVVIKRMVSWRKVFGGVHLNQRGTASSNICNSTPSKSMYLMLGRVQDMLDAYFLKARGASESQRDKGACSALAAKAAALLTQLQGAESLNALPVAADKQSRGVQKQKSTGAVGTAKQGRKKTPQQRPR